MSAFLISSWCLWSSSCTIFSANMSQKGTEKSLYLQYILQHVMELLHPVLLCYTTYLMLISSQQSSDGQRLLPDRAGSHLFHCHRMQARDPLPTGKLPAPHDRVVMPYAVASGHWDL